MGTRVRSPSTTKARGPGETTRRHGPRHVRARASDEARGSVPGDRLGAGHGLAQGESRLPRGRSAPGSVTGQSGWKSGSRACAGRPSSDPLGGPARRWLPRVRRPTQAIHLTHRSGPCLLPCGAPAWSRGRRREGPPCECGRRRIARIVSQGFHRLFGGECSGLSGYIVVAAGRGDSRGLGSPMTEFLPRRPRVLGSPRLVVLAKEGVPPELGTRVRSPSTTKARGPGETTRRHGPRHIRAQKRDTIELAEPTRSKT